MNQRRAGKLPDNLLSKPDPKNRGLLDQLPAKLRGFARTPGQFCVVVLLDADDEDPLELQSNLEEIYRSMSPSPHRALFRIAVEETESWFIADPIAIKNAYPSAKLNKIPDAPLDSIIGAWECLALVLGRKPKECVGADKHEWSTHISPHLDLYDPKSPSLKDFILGINELI